jgi:hypothetical protein
MRRKAAGRDEITSITRESVRAFVPAPLPPDPPVQLEGPLLACGLLDGVSSLLPDPELFLYSYVRREALLSAQIEGTHSSLADLLLVELEEPPGVPFDDVVEVSGYVAGLERRSRPWLSSALPERSPAAGAIGYSPMTPTWRSSVKARSHSREHRRLIEQDFSYVCDTLNSSEQANLQPTNCNPKTSLLQETSIRVVPIQGAGRTRGYFEPGQHLTAA